MSPDAARAILGVPDGYQVAYLLGVGYPADRALKPIRKPNRRPFDEVVHHGHWWEVHTGNYGIDGFSLCSVSATNPG